jgi:type I restriction enzyme R subunit
MSLHKEIHFEVEIAEYLGQHGWVYEDSVSAQYDRARALFPEDVLAWVQESQPEAWQALAKGHGLAADTRLLDQLRQNLDTRGTLDVLRNGIELFPVKSKIALAQFRPAGALLRR